MRACKQHSGDTPDEEPMLELNPLFHRIKDMQERVSVLRGYL